MRHSTIVLSRSEDTSVERRAFEDACVRRLAERDSARVLVMPSLYSMTDAHPALSALKGISDDLVFASWLFPRAAYWVLRARGIEGVLASSDAKSPAALTRAIRAYHLAAFASPEACASELLRAAAPSSKSGSLREIAHGVESRWYPVLDGAACVACRQCYDFCLFGVYTLDENRRPVVTAPDRCKPGCAACARICSEAAIIFPLCESDEGVAGAPGKRPAAEPIDAEAFFARSRRSCPVCGCSCDCERWAGGPLPEGKSVCPACGCLCSASGACACREKLAAPGKSAADSQDSRDDLDGLIDALDQLDV